MQLELSKEDLVNLVKGITPYYSLFENYLVQKCGSYTGGHSDSWRWNENLNSLSEEQLWNLYVICKNSWK